MVININDDRMIMEFLSGRYLGTPDGHAVYMNYPLTGFLAMLYQVLPSVDWYGCFLVAVMSICVILTAYRAAGMTDVKYKKWIYGFACLGVCVFAMGREFFSITYTTVAAVSGAAAVFWYGTSKGSGSDAVVTAILAALTWCIRDELFIMIMPAVGLIWLMRELPGKEKVWKKFVLPTAMIGTVGVCMLCNHIMYSSDEWQEYLRFNELRSEIYDYQDTYYLAGYDEYREYYDRLDLTNEERRMLIYYNFLLIEDDIGRERVTELLKTMTELRADYGANEELLPLKMRIPAKTKQFMKHIVTGAYGSVCNAGVIGFALLLACLLYRKRWKRLGGAAVFFCTGLGMFWIMEIRGRMPERVVYSLSLLLFTTMVLNAIWNRKEFPDHIFFKRAIFVVITGCTVFGLFNCTKTVIENQPVIENEGELENIRSYCNEREENFYFVTGEVLDEYGGVIRSPITDNRRLNYVSTGDWISYSPIEEEKLAGEGITSAAQALLENDNVYLISVKDSANLKFISDYLSFRSGAGVIAAEIESLSEEYGVYCFQII